MKQLIIFIFILVSNIIYSQVPQKFNYQAVARNSQGAVLANQTVGVRESILNIESDGQALYTETHQITTNGLGLFNLSIGAGNVIFGVFGDIPWGEGDKYLKIELDPTGGSNYQLSGTSQFLSVPYALNAGNGSQWHNTYSNWFGYKPGIQYSGNVRIGDLINGNAGPIEPWKLHVSGRDINNSELPVVFEADIDTFKIGIFNEVNTASRIMRLTRKSVNYPDRFYDVGEDEYGNLYFVSNHIYEPKRSFKFDGQNVRIGIGVDQPKSKLHLKDGDIYIEDVSSGVILKSPDGNCWRMTVSNTGQPIFTAITCP